MATIEDFLTTLPPGPIYYHMVGNAGNALIAASAYHIFRRLGIEYHVFDPRGFDAAGKTIVYGGGGGIALHFFYVRRFVQRFHRQAKRLILFPMSVEGNVDLLRELGSNVDIFCRDEFSYQHVRTHAANAHSVGLMDDMALRLSAEYIQEVMWGEPALRGTPLWRKLAAQYRDIYAVRFPWWDIHGSWLPYYRKQLWRLTASPQGEQSDPNGEPRILKCFRSDRESRGMPLPPDNLDLSRILAYAGLLDEPISEYIMHRLFRIVDHYTEIRTDRLHIAIAGALLGKQVFLYSGAYYKNEGVYRYSMQDRFPNVQWVGDGQVAP